MVYFFPLFSIKFDSDKTETCYYIQSTCSKEDIGQDEWTKLYDLLSHGKTYLFSTTSFLDQQLDNPSSITEFGPNLNIVTPWATNALSILKKCEMEFITRIEKSTRTIDVHIISTHFDKMTQTIYKQPLISFDPKDNGLLVDMTLKNYDTIFQIKPDQISIYNDIYQLGFDQTDIQYYESLFEDVIKRHPTNAELIMLGQMNSEHSRHRFFKGKYRVHETALSRQEESNLVSSAQDGVLEMTMTTQYSTEIIETSLMETAQLPLMLCYNNSVIAFSDNASAIAGFRTVQLNQSFNPVTETVQIVDDSSNDEMEDTVSTIKINTSHYLTNRYMYPTKCYLHPTLNAETHNFPTGIAPFEGSATGVGGRIRDTIAIGRGGMMGAGIAGYCVGNLNLGYLWEKTKVPKEIINEPVDILIKASNGASDYGNKIGEPMIAGFTRSFGNIFKYYELLPNEPLTTNSKVKSTLKKTKSWREWFKPIMYSAGLGFIDDLHTEKETAPTMAIIRVGGPAYRIGMCGGSASSRDQDSKNADFDFQAVQRGDPEMENKVVKFIYNCLQMGVNNPIKSIHDQGAGGMANVSTEIADKHGAFIYLRNVNKGDDTLSDIEVWVSEHQEQVTILAHQSDMQLLMALAERENVPIQNVGIISEDNDITVVTSVEVTEETKDKYQGLYVNPDDNEEDDEYKMIEDDDDIDNVTRRKMIKMVDLPIRKSIDVIPRKKYNLISPYVIWLPKHDGTAKYLTFQYSEFQTILSSVLNHVQVGSKKFLTSKVDRSVSGLVSQQQCIGPHQLPLSNFASMAVNHFGSYDASSDGTLTFPGVVSAVGEQPIKGIYDIKKMVHLTVAEMLTNIIWSGIEDMTMIRCSANWMWSNNTPQDKYLLWEAMTTLESILTDLSIAIDGGKDSLSMSVKTSTQEIKGPNTLVLTGYVTSLDIRQKVLPMFTDIGNTIIHCQFSNDYRLGGSTFSQCHNFMSDISGDDVPDFEYDENMSTLFKFVQYHIRDGTITAGHDVSDGGLITTLLEMSFSSNIGFYVSARNCSVNPYSAFFNEEPGLVFEVNPDKSRAFLSNLKKIGYKHSRILGTTSGKKITLTYNSHPLLLEVPVETLRAEWEKTSFQLELKQTNPECVEMEKSESYLTQIDSNMYTIPLKLLNRLTILENEIKLVDNVLRSSLYTSPNCSRVSKVAVIREEGSNGDREMKAVLKLVGFQVYDIHINDIIQQKVSLNSFVGVVFVGGFSYSDVFGAGQGWANSIIYHPIVRKEFDDFYQRPDTFSLGVCNGCQLMGLIDWVPYQSRFIKNDSGRFESRFHGVTIVENNSIMLQSLEGLTFGIWSAHGEGKYYSSEIEASIKEDKFKDYGGSFPMRYVNYTGDITTKYPHNPNGSPMGIASVVSKDGRHLAMMPHPERCFMMWQLGYCPPFWSQKMGYLSPWILMFRNAYVWCQRNMSKE